MRHRARHGSTRPMAWRGSRRERPRSRRRGRAVGLGLAKPAPSTKRRPGVGTRGGYVGTDGKRDFPSACFSGKLRRARTRDGGGAHRSQPRRRPTTVPISGSAMPGDRNQMAPCSPPTRPHRRSPSSRYSPAASRELCGTSSSRGPSVRDQRRCAPRRLSRRSRSSSRPLGGAPRHHRRRSKLNGYRRFRLTTYAAARAAPWSSSIGQPQGHGHPALGGAPRREHLAVTSGFLTVLVAAQLVPD